MKKIPNCTVAKALSNLDKGSKACPIISECRNIGEGLISADSKCSTRGSAFTTGVLALYIVPVGGAAVNAEVKIGISSV